jgi:hypothetical protein
MDTTYGVLCLIPPIVAIGLALWTKQTIFFIHRGLVGVHNDERL